MSAQANLSKSNFVVVATTFFSTSIDESLESHDILLNILALVDKRVGKKRILNMAEKMKLMDYNRLNINGSTVMQSDSIGNKAQPSNLVG